MATITSHYAQAALYGAKRQGINEKSVLTQAGITPELLSAKGARVHEDQMCRLIRLLWDTLKDEFMGFTDHKCKQGSFAMMCQLVSHCDNLQGLLKQGIAFYRLLTDDIIMRIEQNHDEVKFCVTMNNPALDPVHFYLEFWLIIWHRFACWMTGYQIHLKRACFDYPPPAHIEEFRFLFPCEHHFNQRQTCLVFSAHYLSKPLIKTSRELAHFLKYSPAALMTIPGEDNSFRFKIKQKVLHNANNTLTFPGLETLARELHLSPQTLRRKLKAEGNSYRQIKDNIRRDIAIEKLCVHNLSISDVAALLGFAEARSFSRAFKQWTGVSPGSYHQRS